MCLLSVNSHEHVEIGLCSALTRAYTGYSIDKQSSVCRYRYSQSWAAKVASYSTGDNISVFFRFHSWVLNSTSTEYTFYLTSACPEIRMIVYLEGEELGEQIILLPIQRSSRCICKIAEREVEEVLALDSPQEVPNSNRLQPPQGPPFDMTSEVDTAKDSDCNSAIEDSRDVMHEASRDVTNEVPEEIHVEEEVKLAWEKEQVALKDKLKHEDADEWAQLRVTPNNADHHPHVRPLQYLGGVDISFVKDDNVNACAALVVIKLPDLEVVYEDCSHIKLTTPYIPGFLAFREVSFLVEKVKKLQKKSPELMPQVLLCDGNGILHPRGFGVACHLGVLLDMPTLGAAKKLFQVFGLEKNEEHKKKIDQMTETDDRFPLVGNSGRILGMAFRSNAKTKNPIYVSPGHKLTVDTALWVVEQCCKYRVPEPIRQADVRSREFLREHVKAPELLSAADNNFAATNCDGDDCPPKPQPDV